MPFWKSRARRALPVLAAVCTVLVLHVAFMLASGKYPWSKNVYNSYTLQAMAWLDGRLDLGQDYSWLELAVFEGRYYVSFPPFPSYVLLPFAAVFRENTPDGWLALAVTLVGAGYAARIAEKIELSPWYASLLSVFLYTGTAVWQVTVDAWVWFFAQNLAMTLTFMALYAALCGRSGRAMFFLCAAVGCRPFQIVWLPLLLWLLHRTAAGRGDPPGKRVLRLLPRLLPAAVLAASFLLLNLLRFGDPFEFGHNYLPEFNRPGSVQFSLSHIAKNFETLFRLPEWDAETCAPVFPRFEGMNLFLAFPILFWALLIQLAALPPLLRRENAFPRTAAILVLCAAAAEILLLLMHRTMGGAFYGHRYIGDTLPGVFFGLCTLSRFCGFAKGDRPAPGWTVTLGALFALGFWFSFSGVLQFYAQ